MLIADRNGMVSAMKSTPTARDYVQNGLVAMWDGIENAGWGVHDAAATMWKDLIGERDATVASAGSWKDNALHCDGTTYGARYAQNYDGFRTLEVCYKFGGGTNGGIGFLCVVSSGNGNGVLINRDEGSFGFGYYANSPYFLGGPTVGASATVVGVWEADPASNKNTSQYVNGVVVTTTGGSNPGFGSGGAIVFGARQDGARPVVSDMYCLRLYDRALTAAEIAANYAVDAERFNLTGGGA